MSSPEDHEIVDAVGEAVVRDVVRDFYRRVATDDLLRPMYPDGNLRDAEQRLAQFLVFRFGGSQQYLQTRGHPRLRMRHAPFLVDQAARDRWVELMQYAIEECCVPDPAASVMKQFLSTTATFLINS